MANVKENRAFGLKLCIDRMDGYLKAFTSFSKIFQSYQDDGRMVMESIGIEFLTTDYEELIEALSRSYIFAYPKFFVQNTL